MPVTHVYPFIKTTNGAMRPLVPVLIENPLTRQKIGVMALLDTGADANCFPAYIANGIGHNLKHKDVQTSINSGIEGSKTVTWKHSFKIHLLAPDRKTVVWKTKEMLVDCVDHDNMPPLLGCNGFLCELKITFNYKTSRIIIELP
ncbi:MAG: hypothetical protein ACT4ON_13615 [Bacteroidota bacterium]